ncbi:MULTISPECIES: hypothetical protein [unclassified Nocardioides]|uniref:hypothetical protein n=1 Tax=unclassified Nocardioides TaxID=2615069 RepID=UPI0009F0AA7C|nr:MULTISPECIES: hypothetical protein [unclassified Nocardioides]GAW49574.1 hypothetical protein PD653B2_1901 [Nocardioides sp. PD653-B2]GAW57308.1 hypothetical protein PD653_4752 [Nocardioides sp. PD653]
MVTTDPQGVAWSVELRSSGRVAVDVKRWRSWLYAVVGLYMGMISVACLLLADGVGIRVVGALLMLITVPLLVMSVQQVLRLGSWASPVVLVDAEGITVRHGVLRVPWGELSGAIAYSASHNRWIAIVVSDEFYDAWVGSRSWVVRLAGRRRRDRPGTITLPPNLAVDTEAFAAWLTHEALDRLRAQL